MLTYLSLAYLYDRTNRSGVGVCRYFASGCIYSDIEIDKPSGDLAAYKWLARSCQYHD